MRKFDSLDEKTIRGLLFQANIGVCSVDADKKTITWSPNLKNIFGTGKNTYSEKFSAFIKRIYFLDRERIIKQAGEIMEKDKKFRLTFRVNGTDKKLHWLSTNGLVVRNHNGSAVELRGVCIDVSRSKSLEKELKRTIAQLRAVFSSVPVGMTVELRGGVIMYANEEFAKLFSLNGDDEYDASGKNIRHLLRDFIIKDEKGNLIKPSQLPASVVFKGKKKYTKAYSFEYPKTENIKWLKISATAVDSQTLPTEMVIKVFQNVTKEHEEKQNTLNSLGMASHELKNALASLKAYIQLIKRRLLKSDINTAQSYVETLDTQSMRLTKLINDLLDVSRIQSGLLKLNRKKLNYSELLKNIIADFKISQPGHSFSGKIIPDIVISADEDRVVQVLVNLLSNAVKYSAKGTKINISAGMEGNFCVTKIRDHGIGITKSEKKLIFNLFSRGNSKLVRSTKGLGIGLFTSNAIIKEHGGEITFNSIPGKQTTFIIRLPVSEK